MSFPTHAAGFPVKLIHGEHDLVALPKYAASLAKRLNGEFVLLDGAHFTPRENSLQVGAGCDTLVWG